MIFQGCFDQFYSVGVKFDDEILDFWLLNTLSDSWEMFRLSLTNVAPKGNVTMEYVKSGVVNEKMRQRMQGVSSLPEAFVVEHRGRNKNRGQDHNNRG